MNRLVQAGSAYPVAIVGAAGAISIEEITGGLTGGTVVPVRLMSPHNTLTVDGTSTSPTIDKRGWASVGVIVSDNFTGTQVRLQVSTDGNPANYAYFLDHNTGEAWAQPLEASQANAFILAPDIFPFAFVRLVFTDDDGAAQSQSDVIVNYSLIA